MKPYFPQYKRQIPGINKKRSRDGVVPNFVHACDSAHLMRVVNKAASEGITNLATVHDSFGCLASRATRFRQIIREEFVGMYREHNVLQEVLDQAKADLPLSKHKELPSLPAFGTLDLEGALKAEYAFA